MYLPQGRNNMARSSNQENFSMVDNQAEDDSVPDYEFDEAVDRMVNNTSAQRKKRQHKKIVGSCLLTMGIVFLVSSLASKKNGALSVLKLDGLASCDCPTADDLLELGEEGTVDDVHDLKDRSTLEDLQNGAVSTDHPVCSEIGMSILRDKGGNAVDAAIAAALCMGVANPVASGIGGGAFILIHSDKRVGANDEDESRRTDRNLKTSSTHKTSSTTHKTSSTTKKKTTPKTTEPIIPLKVTEFIDAREVAPQMATDDMMEGVKPNTVADGGIYVAVPGELRGLEVAYERHGSIPWEDLVKPSVDLARNGVRVTASLAHDINFHHKKLQLYPNLEKIFVDDKGVEMIKEGDVFKRPDLARTLEAIMENGADVLYEGDIGLELVEDLADAGGILNMKDLENYAPIIREPLISRDIDGFTIATAPPPSSGGAALIGALRFLSGYSEPFAAFRDALSTHRLVEAMRHVFAMRMSMSDPAFDVVGGVSKTEEVVKEMMEGDYMEELRKKTKDSRVLKLFDYGGDKWSLLDNETRRGRREKQNQNEQREKKEGDPFDYLNDHGTAQISVIDKEKNAVSLTTTINTEFGSAIVSPRTGVLLNSQMDNFATPGRSNAYGSPPSEANYIKPGKRPLSSMTPTLVFRNNVKDDENKLFMVFGGGGGPQIISTVIQVFLNHAVLGMSLFDSIAYPRVHDPLLTNGKEKMFYEKKTLLQGPEIKLPDKTHKALGRRGHEMLWHSRTGECNAVSVDGETGLMTAVSDVRKSGRPAGY